MVKQVKVHMLSPRLSNSARVLKTLTWLSHLAAECRGTDCVSNPKTHQFLKVMWDFKLAEKESFFQRRMSASSSVLLCVVTSSAMLALGPLKISTCLWRGALHLPKLWHLCGIFLRGPDKLPSLNCPFYTSKWYRCFCCGDFKWEGQMQHALDC